MPEMMVHQASGLLGLAEHACPQLIAMVSHGDARTEQPTLWQLCGTLSALNYSVMVLDGTTRETPNNPGLQQLLEYRFGYAPIENAVNDCQIIPADIGLNLLESPQQLTLSGHLFSADSVVILYADCQRLVRLLQGSQVTPLISLSQEKNSVLTSYLALKRLLRDAQLEPLFLNMIEPARTRNVRAPTTLPGGIGACARHFLGYEVTALTIHSSSHANQRDPQMRQLALCLLENALPLRGHAVAAAHAATWNAGFMSRSS
jgi:hypothetical protein